MTKGADILLLTCDVSGHANLDYGMPCGNRYNEFAGVTSAQGCRYASRTCEQCAEFLRLLLLGS